ncbi:unnamed protein product [Miscanthus lutarioriparius]|uniref:Uncharacterized protein n=1 Tax=Miscanthus lutarioriparius TaxID=422564 RepID=A0A811QEF2_9POAL|nr:unnamed protein product [Miscanthus lutarioriparius]
MTTRGAVACSEAPREVLGAPLLLNAGEGRPAGCPTETPGASMDRDPAKMAAERAAKFIIRGSLILLGLYLFNSMREYAINYTGGDIQFSTFAAIVVAVPIAEMFCILGQTLVPPLSRPPIIGSSTPCAACGYACADSEVPTEEADDAPFLDLEKGPSRHTTVPVPAPRRAAIEAALDMDAARIAKCIVRGLLVLLWVYLVDLMRRFIATHEASLSSYAF